VGRCTLHHHEPGAALANLTPLQPNNRARRQAKILSLRQLHASQPSVPAELPVTVAADNCDEAKNNGVGQEEVRRFGEERIRPVGRIELKLSCAILVSVPLLRRETGSWPDLMSP